MSQGDSHVDLYASKWRSGQQTGHKEPASYQKWGGKQDKGKSRWRVQRAQAPMAVGVRRRGRRKTLGRQFGPQRKDAVSGAKISGTYIKNLDGKKATLRRTYKCQTGANDNFWSLNRDTEKVLDTLEILCARFEQVNGDVADVDKKFDKEFAEMEDAMEKAKEAQGLTEIAMNAAGATREHYRRFTTSFGKTKNSIE